MASYSGIGKHNSSDSSNEIKKDNPLNKTIKDFEEKSLLSNSELKDFHVYTEEDKELFVIMSGHDFNSFVDPFGYPLKSNTSNVDKIECKKVISVNNSTSLKESPVPNEKENCKFLVDNQTPIKTILSSTKKSRLHLSKSFSDDDLFDQDDEEFDKKSTVLKRKTAFRRQ